MCASKKGVGWRPKTATNSTFHSSSPDGAKAQDPDIKHQIQKSFTEGFYHYYYLTNFLNVSHIKH